MSNPNSSSLKTCGRAEIPASLIKIIILALTVSSASADTEQWLGVPGTSATTNWTDVANWNGPQQTYYNQVQFTGTGASANNNFSVNNVLDSATGVAQMPVWELDYVPVNGNYTTLINPGVSLTLGAGWGSMYVGADALNNSSPAAANAVETITILGPGASMSMSGGLYLGQGSTTPGDTHNVTLDLSGLDNFYDDSSYDIYVASGGIERGNGILYLAKTNQISVADSFQICNQNYSNSLPCAVYLGDVNTVTTGTGNLIVGGSGTLAGGALMEFNPAFLTGGNVPTAYFNGSGVSGRIPNFWICNENGGANVSGSSLVDFTGGNVTMYVSTMQLGQAGSSSALGTLTYDNGVVNVENATVGNQEITTGGTGVGVVNLNSNSTASASATLQVNQTLTLAAVTGTLTAGTAGSVNVNGGALIASTIVSGGGNSAINLNSGTLTLGGLAGSAALPITSLATTNSTLSLPVIAGTNAVFVSNLLTGGATNIINIISASPFASYPTQVTLVKYSGSIGGAGFNFGLGTLPSLYAGYLVNNTANHSVDLMLTSGSRNLTWTGGVSGNWDTTTANWTIDDGAATYADGDYVQFIDGAVNSNIDLTATLSPGSITVSNNAQVFTFDGSGALGGSGALVKSGAGTLILDNGGNNTFSGGFTIDSGAVQVGNNDTSGSLPSVSITDNGSLVFAQSEAATITNAISGTGAVVQAGAGGTLALTGGNTFTGNVLVTNSSTLQNGSAAALGASSGSLIIANGSTFDANGNASPKPIIVAGAGVGGNGAITDTGGAVYGLANSITMTGDTTFNYPNRWDLYDSLSTGGNAYNLTLNGSTYFEWDNVVCDSALSNIDLLSGTWGIVGTSSFGNPASTLTLSPASTLAFWGSSTVMNKGVDFQNGATIVNERDNNIMTGAMTLEAGYDSFQISGQLTVSNVLTGSGFLYMNGGSGELILSGNSPSFSGGVGLYQGEVAVDGTIGSGVTSEANTIVAGSGTVSGLTDVSGELAPGDVGVVGTYSAGGGLKLEGGATMVCDLDTTTNGNNDLVQVTGDLTVNGNNITINPYNGGLASGTYILATYTGNLNGSFGTVATASPSPYTMSLNIVTTTSPNQVQLIVANTATISDLSWNNASGNSQWDVDTSANWTNLTTHLSADVFQFPDPVLFSDAITNSASPGTTINIPSGQVVIPTVITNNSTVNYLINGSGKISGAAALVKQGTGTLEMDTANDYRGNNLIAGGTVQMDEPLYGSTSTLGATNGTIYVTNGATLVVNSASYYGIGTRPLVVSGAGVGGNGALIGANTIYNGSSDNGGLFRTLTLAGNATLGSTNGRCDLGNASGGIPTIISTMGNNYNLTILQQGYSEWHEVTIDTNLGNIDYYLNSPTTWYLVGEGGSLGNPTNVLTLHPGVGMYIAHDGVNNADSGYAKVVHVMTNSSFTFQPGGGNGDYYLGTSLELDGGAGWNFYSIEGGDNTGLKVGGAVTLNGPTHLQTGDAPITFTNVISGTGGFVWDNYNNQFVFTASNTYSGTTAIGNSRNLVLSGNGSIASSALIFFGGNNSGNDSLDVSGRPDKTLTLASGQTLAGIGLVGGNLVVSAGATLSPAGTNVMLGITSGASATGTLSASNNITLNGTTVIKLDGSGVNDGIQSTTGSITYGGTLNLVNISGSALAAGNSFQVFTAADSYSGSFSSVVPATPGPGLAWNFSQLGTGLVTVAAASHVVIQSPYVAGGNLVFSGSGGTSGNIFYVLANTNLATTNWFPVLTNTFNGSGGFTVTNPVSPSTPQEFYRIQY